MVLNTIYITRHAFRASYSLDPETGVYTSAVRSPTGIPSDPPLTSYGEEQSRQLARYLHSLTPPIDRVYSSPMYRCLQTLQPSAELARSSTSSSSASTAWDVVRIENGIGEWYGAAPFAHPSPAPPSLLHSLFPFTDKSYIPLTQVSAHGETIPQLYERVETTLQRIVDTLDQEPDQPRSLLICSHAATVIAAARILTGRIPDDPGELDFQPFTCGMFVFKRDEQPESEPESGDKEKQSTAVGVLGGWECTVKEDCSFLDGGAERSWRFSGDESFSLDTGPGHVHGHSHGHRTRSVADTDANSVGAAAGGVGVGLREEGKRSAGSRL